MMAAWVWQGCHTLLWFMKKETMACGHSLLYVFKVRVYQQSWLVHLRQVHPLSVSTELVDCVGMAGMPYPPTSQSCLHASHGDHLQMES